MLEGEIRTFSSEPVSFLVLKHWDEGVWMMVPFSSRDLPYEEGELLADTGLPGCSVLSVWNTHTFPEDILENSRLIGSMQRERLEDVWNLFRYLLTGEGSVSRSPDSIFLVPDSFESDPSYKRKELMKIRKILFA
jgi:hypothetical protein